MSGYPLPVATAFLGGDPLGKLKIFDGFLLTSLNLRQMLYNGGNDIND
jgi:hypothetical protein